MDDDELYEQAKIIWAAIEYGGRDRAIAVMKLWLLTAESERSRGRVVD